MTEHADLTDRSERDASSGETPAVSVDASFDYSEEMTPQQLAETKRYGKQKLVCRLVDMALDLTFLTVVAFVIAQPLDHGLHELPLLANRWLRLPVFFLAIAAMQLCLSLPLAIYTGHLLEHRFGLSRQSFRRWLWRWAKRTALATAFGLVMIEGLYFLIWLTGAWWWLVAAAAFFAVSMILGQLVPVLILPMFYKIERMRDDELAQRFRQLAKGTGLTIEGVYRMDMSRETVKANAMLAGLGRTRRVILGDTLLDNFSSDEIDVVLAHELGHHVFRHIPILIGLGLIYSVASFFLCDRILVAWLGADLQYADLPVHVLPLLILAITLLSMLLGPLQNALSRHFERQCDRYALNRTGLNDAYRSAFTKLAKQNKADPNPPALEVVLFHDHPPIAERLKMAE